MCLSVCVWVGKACRRQWLAATNNVLNLMKDFDYKWHYMELPPCPRMCVCACVWSLALPLSLPPFRRVISPSNFHSFLLSHNPISARIQPDGIFHLRSDSTCGNLWKLLAPKWTGASLKLARIIGHTNGARAVRDNFKFLSSHRKYFTFAAHSNSMLASRGRGRVEEKEYRLCTVYATYSTLTGRQINWCCALLPCGPCSPRCFSNN